MSHRDILPLRPEDDGHDDDPPPPPVINLPLLYGGRNGQGEDGGGGGGWGERGNYQRGGSADAPPPPGDGAGPLPHGIDTFLLCEGRIGRGGVRGRGPRYDALFSVFSGFLCNILLSVFLIVFN